VVPLLSLNSNLEQKSLRDGFGEGILELGKQDERVVTLSADLSESLSLDEFKKLFPKRYLECGIAEQNMLEVAAGLAAVGKIPFACTFGCFWLRAIDQIRVSVCYSNFNVKLISSHCGLATGSDGATHQVLEDIAIMRVLPGMNVVTPCDYEEARKATLAIASLQAPVYLRLARQKKAVFTTPTTPFIFGKAQIFRTGKDITVVANGVLVYEALLAAEKLKGQLDVEVINLSTIKPIDRETLIESAKKTGRVITCEDHQVVGGMGSAVVEVLAEACPVPIKMIGVQDCFGESGSAEELMQKYGLSVERIIEEIQKIAR